MSLGGRGFARDQEVFETPDPSEEEPHQYQDDSQSESVRQLDASVQSSYEKFKGKSLDARAADFSDRIGRPMQCGFRTEPDDYEMAALERAPETLMQRYHRLRQEVSALAEDVAEVQALQEGTEKVLAVSPTDLAADLEVLQQQLHGLRLDRVLGTQLLTAPEHPHQTVLLRDLKAQIEQLRAGASQAGAETSDQPTYEVYTRPETAKFAHLSKLSEVEARLTQLETLVGNKEDAVSTVAAGLDAEQRDLSSSVLNVQAKVALLDAAHINTIAVQLEMLLGLLEQVEAKEKAAAPSSEREAKITDAMETITRFSAIAPLVPDLVARLHTLKDLHERAAQFAGSVAFMSDSQDHLTTQISSLQALLAKLQDTLQENLSTVQNNFQSLESRVSALQGSS